MLKRLDCLTRRQHETYDEFIDRIQPNTLASTVKLLDLEDNSDLSRITNPSEEDYQRVAKYNNAMNKLKQKV